MKQGNAIRHICNRPVLLPVGMQNLTAGCIVHWETEVSQISILWWCE